MTKTGPASYQHLLLVVSGSLSAAFVPTWATWLRTHRPEVTTRTIVTRSAMRFVTSSALAAATGGRVDVDAWPDAEEGSDVGALHAELAEWADAVIVCPASWHYVARLSLGLGDSPSLLALHTAGVPVLVAPSLPPGSLDSPILQEHLERLRARPGYVLAPMLVATSATSGRPGALVPPALPDLVELLEEHLHSDEPTARPASRTTGRVVP